MSEWTGDLTLADVLRTAGVEDLAEVLVIRHTFKEAGLPTPEAATATRVLEYTRRQDRKSLKFPKSPPRWWLVFLADGKKRARLYGAYENRGEATGEATAGSRFYDLIESDLLDALDGRLVIEWSADTINWAKRGDSAVKFSVVEISDPGVVPFPGFDRVSLTYAQLLEVIEDARYESWRTALGAVQGIYLIADSKSGQLYVGKADGAARVLGRWRDYAATGHGGNIGLRRVLAQDPDRVEHFTWSLLRVFGSNTTPDEVDRAESHFKDTLLTRRFGYNWN